MAKDGEVAHSFQPLMEGSRSFFWGAHGGQVADPMIEAAEYEKKQAAQQRADKVKQLRQLLKDHERLLAQQDKAIETLCDQVIELPGQADRALAALEMNPDFARWYNKKWSALENYRKNRPVGELMAEWLEDQFPEQFETVRQSYRDKLAAIDAQVAAFEKEGIRAKYLR